MTPNAERDLLCSQVNSLLDDPAFRQRLQTLVQNHLDLLHEQQQQQQFILQILSAPLDNEFVALLLHTLDKTHLTYLPTQFVPNRFGQLERNGLVHCAYGPTDAAGLGTRTITLTSKGHEVAQHHARIRAAFQAQHAVQTLIEKTRQSPNIS